MERLSLQDPVTFVGNNHGPVFMAANLVKAL
jgi:hypothetical protein